MANNDCNIPDMINLINFPEEIDEKDNIKIYGEISRENQLDIVFR